MAGKVLRVLARGMASAPIHSAHARGMARFVGRVDDFDLGTPYEATDDAGMKVPGIMPARVCSPEPTIFAQDADPSEFTEQLLHLRELVLWPFDAETARMAGVPFDPTYGGEYVKGADGKLVSVDHRDALAALKAASPAPSPAPVPSLKYASALSAEEKK